MKDALDPLVVRDIASAARSGILLAFDLDGTLAPIVARPGDAFVPDAITNALVALAARHPVAIVTGRSVDDARGKLGFTPQYIIGNHGAEGLPGHERERERYRAVTAGWLSTLAASGLPDRYPGVLIEDKVCSLSLHYRLEKDPGRARDDLLAAACALVPEPRIVEGKCVLNLVMPDAPHKGDALAALLAHVGTPHGLYAGDDATDEDVFRACLPNVFTIRVEPRGSTAAEYVLAHQQDMTRFLEALVAARP